MGWGDAVENKKEMRPFSDDDVKSFLTFNYKTRMRTTEIETREPKEKRFWKRT